jgi:4-hydroxy-3-methylbut-2-enyl diphosphate reductase
VVAQTTQPSTRVQDLLNALQQARPHSAVVFRDTVCQPTKDRQHALDALIDRCQAVVVVGGRNSNNTRQLVETVRRAGRLAWQVECAAELSPRWFDGLTDIGLTAGTSTPDETIASVRHRLESFATAALRGMLTGSARA